MFSKLPLLVLIAISCHMAWAEEGSGEQSDGEHNEHEKQSLFPQLPFFPDFSSILQNFPGFGGSSSGFQFPGFGSNSRDTRSVEDPEDQDHDDGHQSRFFFSLFPAIGSCNYTANPGRSCASCTQSRVCLRNNVAILRTCRGLFRHCNAGRCSLRQSASCSGAAATTVAATTAAATTAAATTAAATTAAPTTTA